MKSQRLSKFEKLLTSEAKRITSEAQLVERTFITDGDALLVISPKNRDLNLLFWLKTNFEKCKKDLYKFGGILFRGFRIENADDFSQFITAIKGVPMEYKNRSSPRSEVLKNIYTSTDYPRDQKINMHNEMDYDIDWPMLIAFYCQIAPATGGETPIVDSRKVLQNISEKTREKFENGIHYIRNLTPELGLSAEEVFQTNSKNEIRQFCSERKMIPEWVSSDHLRITWNRPAIRKHPITEEQVWFNHGYFFNYRTLEPSICQIINHENLPYNTCYADGSQIEAPIIEELRDAYENSKITFSWQQGDVLLLDNMLMAHSRNSYTGNRKILVAMCNPRFANL